MYTFVFFILAAVRKKTKLVEKLLPSAVQPTDCVKRFFFLLFSSLLVFPFLSSPNFAFDV